MNEAIPYVKVFLTSNREFDIESLAPWTRHRTYTTPPTVVAHDLDPNRGAPVGEDIERYLQAQFAKRQQTCVLPPGFPSSADTAALARLANGSFVYARTAWEYICGTDDSETPVRRLASLIKAALSPALHEGTHVHLDELCSQILVTALRGSPHDHTAADSERNSRSTSATPGSGIMYDVGKVGRRLGKPMRRFSAPHRSSAAFQARRRVCTDRPGFRGCVLETSRICRVPL
jgi:hypothetical protein